MLSYISFFTDIWQSSDIFGTQIRKNTYGIQLFWHPIWIYFKYGSKSDI